jgi:hypothetical protein
MKVIAKMVGLSRCNGKEGKVYDGMYTFVTLNLSRSRGKPALLPVEDGLKGWMVVVDVDRRWSM